MKTFTQAVGITQSVHSRKPCRVVRKSTRLVSLVLQHARKRSFGLRCNEVEFGPWPSRQRSADGHGLEVRERFSLIFVGDNHAGFMTRGGFFGRCLVSRISRPMVADSNRPVAPDVEIVRGIDAVSGIVSAVDFAEVRFHFVCLSLTSGNRPVGCNSLLRVQYEPLS